MQRADDAPVVLFIPNDTSFLPAVALLVASLAVDLNFDFDEIASIRSASEAAVGTAMAASGPESQICVHLFLARQEIVLLASGLTVDPEVRATLNPMRAGTVRGFVRSIDVALADGRVEVGFRAGPPRFLHE